jgi:hypothetical protein
MHKTVSKTEAAIVIGSLGLIVVWPIWVYFSRMRQRRYDSEMLIATLKDSARTVTAEIVTPQEARAQRRVTTEDLETIKKKRERL